MIRFVSGDMFGQDFNVRVNTVNCVGVMGAGVALAFKQRYPEMFREYKRECDAGRLQPGKLHTWETLSGERIVNFPTKRHWREMSQYEDIEAGLKALRAYLTPLGRITVALPALGCGHGGLEWGRVRSMIEQELTGLEAEISVFEPGDSRRAGREARVSEPLDTAALAEAGVRVLSAGDPGFPAALADQGIDVLFARGDESISRSPHVAVLLAFKPEDREINAAEQCVTSISRQHVTVSVSSTSRAARGLIETAIAAGSNVIAWLPEGMLARKTPEWVDEHVRSRRMLLLSTVPPSHAWSPRYAKEAGVCAAALADAVLVSDPEPTWLSTFPNARQLGAARRLFHLNYGRSSQASSLLSEIGSTSISRSPDNQPNIQPILAAVRHETETTVRAHDQEAHMQESPAPRSKPEKPTQAARAGEQPYLIDVTPHDLFNTDERTAEAAAAAPARGKRKGKKNGNNGYEPPNLAKAIRLPVPDFSDPNRRKTCLEVDFPIAPINALSKLEGNAGKPIYQMSKWWARRRSSIFRAMLIAAGTEAPDNPEEAAKRVWDHYYCNHQKAGSFKKLRVLDPFMGGGTTLVEGSRLGFQLTGVDLNPVAWFIVKNELACSDPAQVKAFFDEIEAEVKPQIQPFYTTTCPRGHKGRWIDVRTDRPAPDELDPINLAPEERRHYRWEGPEVIYTFWAKHGPCAGSQGQPCGHRTPIFRSPVIAEKKLTAYYIPIDCPACGYQFHAELGETRMAPGCERVVVDNEFPFTEVTQALAQELKDYSKGKVMEKRERVERLLAGIDAEPGFQCPHCRAFAGGDVKRVLTRHAKPSTRAGDIKKKDLGIESKHVFMYLLIDPKWFEGAPEKDDDGREFGGWAGAEPEATARWWNKRLEALDLIEVRGRVKLAEDESASDEDEEEVGDDEAAEGGGEEEADEDADRKKYAPPARITLSDGRTVDTRKGTVPGKSQFRCDADGIEQDILTAVSKTERTAPVAPYVLQCCCPFCRDAGFNYGGRFFRRTDDHDILRLVVAENEWKSRRDEDLKGFWPTSECWDAYMMRANGGVNRGWGYSHWWKMFNPRQLIGHATLAKSIADLAATSFPLDIGEQALGAFQQYLRNQNMFAFYHVKRDCLAPAMSNANYHPKHLTIEVGPFSPGYGPWSSTSSNTIDGVQWAHEAWDSVMLADDSTKKSMRVFPEDCVTTESTTLLCTSSTDLAPHDAGDFDLSITDPPFGNNLFYADLADFFYVWIRLVLLRVYEGLPEQAYFEPERTPHAIEAVQNSVEHPDDREPWEEDPLISEKWLRTVRQYAGDETLQVGEGNPLYRREPASQFYCDTLTACWAESGRVLKPGGLMAFTFHHSADAPWVDVLEALFNAGFILEATYPIRSDETKGETAAFGSKKIEYDIIHVCRKRLEKPEPVAWAKMRRWVKDEAARYKALLEHVHGRALNAADVRVILIGKSLEFYSQHYGQVLTGDGQVLQVREALLGINQLLDDLIAGAGGTVKRPPECEPGSRLILSLFQERDEMSRDELSKTLRGTGVEPNDLQARGWVRIVGTKVHAVPLDERMSYFTQRGRTRKAALKTDLDQAHFLIGAARDGSGLSIDRELDNWSANLKRSTDAILRWYAETARDRDVRAAAERAVRLVDAWRNKPRPRDAQMSLFAALDEAAETGAA